jgi:RNA-directed DNA polymerase
MTQASIRLQDLRRRIYRKAKTDPTWRFWGLYVHVCKPETLREAYRLAKKNHGAPGIDGVTFDAIEASGVDRFLQQLHDELVTGTYRPMRHRHTTIPKDSGTKVRVLSIPTIRDRVVQGALKLILEPIFEADFQDGAFGYRPRRTPHQAVQRIAVAALHKAQVIDVDLATYFDVVRHDILLRKVAARVNDDQVLHLLKHILKAGGKRGLAQGGVLSPVLSNLYLTEVDRMLEQAKAVTREGAYTRVEYARFADDLVILVDSQRRGAWLGQAVFRRLLAELGKLDVAINQDKTRVVDLRQGTRFTFLGFDFRRGTARSGNPTVWTTPRLKARTALLAKLRGIFRQSTSQPVHQVVARINPIIRGWVNYFRIGNAGRCFRSVRDWIEKKVRRHLMRARGRHGFGWNRWSKAGLYQTLGLYGDYVVRYVPRPKALPV